jgi:hypothetical protein
MTTLTQGSLLSFPSIESQLTLLKIEFNYRYARHNFKFTEKPSSNQHKLTIEKSLTPIVEKKMSMKYLAENTIEELAKLVVEKCDELLKDNMSLTPVYIIIPTEETPCIWLEDDLIKGELSFYVG